MLLLRESIFKRIKGHIFEIHSYKLQKRTVKEMLQPRIAKRPQILEPRYMVLIDHIPGSGFNHVETNVICLLTSARHLDNVMYQSKVQIP